MKKTNIQYSKISNNRKIIFLQEHPKEFDDNTNIVFNLNREQAISLAHQILSKEGLKKNNRWKNIKFENIIKILGIISLITLLGIAILLIFNNKIEIGLIILVFLLASLTMARVDRLEDKVRKINNTLIEEH